MACSFFTACNACISRCLACSVCTTRGVACSVHKCMVYAIRTVCNALCMAYAEYEKVLSEDSSPAEVAGLEAATSGRPSPPPHTHSSTLLPHSLPAACYSVPLLLLLPATPHPVLLWTMRAESDRVKFQTSDLDQRWPSSYHCQGWCWERPPRCLPPSFCHSQWMRQYRSAEQLWLQDFLCLALQGSQGLATCEGLQRSLGRSGRRR